jgi:hypothetical protein
MFPSIANMGPIWRGSRALCTDSVRGSTESLMLEFKQESEKMPRQVRAMVQQVLDKARDKWEIGSSSALLTSPIVLTRWQLRGRLWELVHWEPGGGGVFHQAGGHAHTVTRAPTRGCRTT